MHTDLTHAPLWSCPEALRYRWDRNEQRGFINVGLGRVFLVWKRGV